MAIRLLAVRRAERNTIVESSGVCGRLVLLPMATATQRYVQYLSILQQIHTNSSD
jgi:hypothetical protein